MASEFETMNPEIEERIRRIENALEHASGLSAGDLLVPLLAFLGAALAAVVHWYIGKRTLRANVIAEARKVWMSELRRDLADLLAEVYMPFSSNSEDYDTKKRVYAAVGRVRLRLTPENLRNQAVQLDRDRHQCLEGAIEKLSRLLFEYMDGEVDYEDVHKQANKVEDVARRIFYGTWDQVKSDVQGEGVWMPWKKREDS